MENFEKNKEQVKFENISKFIEQLKATVASQELTEEDAEIVTKKIAILEWALNNSVTKEGKEYLNSLPIEVIEKFSLGHFRDLFRGGTIEERQVLLTKVGIENILMYLEVRGYDNPELELREKTNPTPTTEEVLMGCYLEQIENHTRKAVQILRRKGYNTVESGFAYPVEKGGQFFHLVSNVTIKFNPEIIKKIEKENSVNITIEQEKSHWFIRFKNIDEYSKKIPEWEKILTEFAEQVDPIGEIDFAPNGATVSFAEKIIKTFPKEEILKTAETQHEQDLIRMLYSCGSEEDFKKIIKIKES